MRIWLAALSGAWLFACGQPAAAQASPATGAPPSPPPKTGLGPPAPCCTIAARTEIQLELVDPVSSATRKAGDTFGIRLAQPIVVDGQIVAPAGVLGQGEVIDAAPPGMGGKAGKLVLAARFLMSGGTQLPLQSLKLGTGAGQGYGRSALAVSAVAGEVIPFGGFVGLLVTGGNITYTAGAPATAKLATSVTLPAIAPASQAVQPTSARQPLPPTNALEPTP